MANRKVIWDIPALHQFNAAIKYIAQDSKSLSASFVFAILKWNQRNIDLQYRGEKDYQCDEPGTVDGQDTFEKCR